MFSKVLLRFFAVTALLALGACGSAPYAPVVAQSDPIDLTAYERKADTFIVLLDTSGSMQDEDSGRPRIDNAEDWTASFNNTVPDGVGFNAGIITFGKGATGSCIGYGIASQLYGPTVYSKSDFANALGSIECAASTTPIADALTMNTDLLAPTDGSDPGQTAVIIVSDFVWDDPAAVADALADLRAQHPDSVCVHTVKVGNDATHDAMIASLTDTDGCDSAVNAADVASGAALTNFTAGALLSPLELVYEAHVISGDVLFDFDKSVLKESGKEELAAINAVINSQGLLVKDIDLIGHTDSIGTAEYNQALSERRAKAVYDYLVGRGADGSIIDVMGVGKADPAASNATAEGRAMNRRVEVLVGTSP